MSRKHKEICPGKPQDSATNTTDKTTASTTTTSTTAETTQSQHQQQQQAADSESEYSSGDDDSSLEEGWEMTDDMKVALRNSTWLREELQDGGLRDMIASVVKSERRHKSHFRKQKYQRGRRPPPPIHPHEDLTKKRRENTNFNAFTDKLLVLADVLERQDEDLDNSRNEEELEEWLRRKWDPSMPR
eukprot:CAMPEP_0116146070 /NCGR_PEP_ID=MMETSP0329-20121206/16963_1 /TAXON_ID=697910 /ORGANISM="Pseudo-nitzschia arenysensis, Strain B593" /LENGTH=186 /DNA_ID=CAMNT_0003641783 /DNA_START=148 /DNA_END=705 /DNA_ORIENTATION=+